ncbi:MAG TPA: acyl-CoA dehydrogenase family protein [Actinomycetota bacterium]|jgi:alkylation response protein AidB-like acyl-CoA dehydrogenase|nr:acyl-CoA dehydrogenase family protein [Actinomycetota bacterium]
MSTSEVREELVRTVREFVDKEVIPAAPALERDDVYPAELVEQLGAMGFFGATIPESFGGMGLDFVTYAMCVEELCRGFMSLSGVFNTHLICAHIVGKHGTDDQRAEWLPKLASGERRSGLALTEPGCGSDLQAIRTVARRIDGEYVVQGNKMFITNGEHGNVFATLVKTNPDIEPSHHGMSCLLMEKGDGFDISKHIDKLGYRAVDTVELVLDGVRVPASGLVGGDEGNGFAQVMDGLETGRVNIAARAVGVARAAFDAAIRYAQQRETFGRPIAEHQAIQFMLADMATKIEAARLLYLRAAELKDAGERADLEAGMAKLFASEMCREVAVDAMRVHGGYGYSAEFPVERYYRDAPLMIIGEGTNEIQRLVIARRLLDRYAL